MPDVVVYASRNIRKKWVKMIKKALPKVVAEALNSAYHTAKGKAPEGKDKFQPRMIFVEHRWYRRSDKNTTPLYVVIQAGESKGRDADAVCTHIMNAVRAGTSKKFMGGEKEGSCWIRFSEPNSYATFKI